MSDMSARALQNRFVTPRYNDPVERLVTPPTCNGVCAGQGMFRRYKMAL